MSSSQHNQVICTQTRRRLTVGALALIAALWALTVPGRAAGLKQGMSSPGALAAATDSLTGTPDDGQLSVKNVCGAPGAGRASCLAALLTTTANGQALALAPVSASEPARTVAGAPNLFAAPLAALQSAPASTAEPAAGTPAYLQQAYDLSSLSQTAGTGDTVAIVDAYDDPNAESDLAAYRANYGLPACSTANGCFEKVNESGGTSYPAPDSDWAVEISLDLDAVSALCPNCHIALVEANSDYLSDLSVAEAEAVALGAQQVSNSWAGPGAAAWASGWSFPGTAILAAAGDSGWWGNGAAYYPASLENVTAVGGTSLAPSSVSSSAPRGFSESAWGYQYNGTWYGTGSGCDTSEQKPTWQTDSGCAGRTSTDISADADPNTGLRVYDTYRTGGGSGWFAVGGTSLASPLTAAYYALTQAQSANPAPPEWAYANAASLNDPTSGENGGCGSYLCQAGPGYDGPTGNGSISGDVVAGAPGIGGPGQSGTYATTTTNSGTQVSAGVYPNGRDTSLSIEYGTTSAYGQQTPTVDVGSSSAPQLAAVTIAGLQAGATYHYRLVAQNAEGTTYGYDFTLTTGQSAPVNQTPPSVSGTAQEGSVLSASAGSWTGLGNTYSYQWQRSSDSGKTWAPIATGNSYTPVAGDLGAQLEVLVSASNAQGSATAASAPTGAVSSGAPVNTAPPSVTGTALSGQTLSASTGTWTGAGSLTYAYQWRESSGQAYAPIADVTSSYMLQSSDAGQSIEVTVTATNTYGSASATSTPPTVIGTGTPVNQTPPSITGTGQRGDKLTAHAGVWAPAASAYAYQWLRNAGSGYVAIATGVSYTLQKADEGASIELAVTAKNAFGAGAATSAATSAVSSAPPVASEPPSIAGVAQRGSVLHETSTGSWTGLGNSYSYQWMDCNAQGQSCQPITGAKRTSYTLMHTDVGQTVAFEVIANNTDARVSAVSVPSAVIAALAPAAGKNPAIAGTARVGSTLRKSSIGSWTGLGNTYGYQWLDCSAQGGSCQPITGKTATTYTVAPSDAGDTIALQVNATNPDGNASATSAPSVPVPGSS